jgi:hypothetical protein
MREYVTVNVIEEFPALWEEYQTYMGKNEIIGPNSFNNFLKHKQINGFVKYGERIGTAQIRHEHLMWLKLQY